MQHHAVQKSCRTTAHSQYYAAYLSPCSALALGRCTAFHHGTPGLGSWHARRGYVITRVEA